MLAQRDTENKAGSAQQIHGSNVTTSLVGFIRMPGVDDHDNGGHRVRNCEEDAILQCAESPTLQSIGKKRHATVSRAIVQKINCDHDEKSRLLKPFEERNGPWRL